MPKTDNTESIQETLQLMELSSMEDDEKTMWKVLLPSLETAEINKLKDALTKEKEVMTDLLLKAQKK